MRYKIYTYILVIGIIAGCKAKKHPSDCKEIIKTFIYPEDLTRFDSLNYVCDDNPIPKKFLGPKQKAIPYFDDKNYSLFYRDDETKLLFDKRNELYFCFKSRYDADPFVRTSIDKIYILGKYKLPLFSIENYFSDSIRYCENRYPLTSIKNYFEKPYADIEKYDYTASNEKLYVYVLEMKNNKKVKLEKLTYSELVDIAKALLGGEYIQTSKLYHEDKHFKTNPLWEKH